MNGGGSAKALRLKTHLRKTASILFAALLLCLCSLFGPAGTAFAAGGSDSVVATIYVTNDVHGYIGNSTSDAGLCYAAAAQMKKNGGVDTYLIDAGDHISGSIYATHDRGSTLVQAMKSAQYDFAVPGNHEFDYGVDRFLEMRELAKSADGGLGTFDYYACNFWHIEQGSKTGGVLEPYKIIETSEGVRIALIGIMTPETISKTAMGFFQDKDGNTLYAIDGATKDSRDEELYKTVQYNIDKARSEADIVIGVGHLGVNPESGFNQSTALIAHTFGLDAFIDGHSHTVLHSTVPDLINRAIPCLQTGSGFENIGELVITESIPGSYTIESKIIPSQQYGTGSRDKATLDIEKGWAEKVNSAYAEIIATTSINLCDNADPIQRPSTGRLVRMRETNLGDLVADSMYWSGNVANGLIGENLQCDAALIQGGAIRNQIAAGDISLKQCTDALPFISQYAVAEMSGQTLLDALEFSSREYGAQSECAALFHVAGMTYQVDTSKPSTIVIDENGLWKSGPSDGQYRVKSVKIYNKETGAYADLDLNKRYRIAGLDYFFDNYGDGFTMFRSSDVKTSTYGFLMPAILGDYLKHFDAASSGTGELPTIASVNSPLFSYANYLLLYESQMGANRFGAYAASFDTADGSYVPTQYVYPGWNAFEPLDPVKEGSMFVGWFGSPQLSAPYDFSAPINADTNIYAAWKSSKKDDPQKDDPQKDDPQKEDPQNDAPQNTQSDKSSNVKHSAQTQKSTLSAAKGANASSSAAIDTGDTPLLLLILPALSLGLLCIASARKAW